MKIDQLEVLGNVDALCTILGLLIAENQTDEQISTLIKTLDSVCADIEEDEEPTDESEEKEKALFLYRKGQHIMFEKMQERIRMAAEKHPIANQ